MFDVKQRLIDLAKQTLWDWFTSAGWWYLLIAAAALLLILLALSAVLSRLQKATPGLIACAAIALGGAWYFRPAPPPPTPTVLRPPMVVNLHADETWRELKAGFWKAKDGVEGLADALGAEASRLTGRLRAGWDALPPGAELERRDASHRAEVEQAEAERQRNAAAQAKKLKEEHDRQVRHLREAKRKALRRGVFGELTGQAEAAGQELDAILRQNAIAEEQQRAAMNRAMQPRTFVAPPVVVRKQR